MNQKACIDCGQTLGLYEKWTYPHAKRCANCADRAGEKAVLILDKPIDDERKACIDCGQALGLYEKWTYPHATRCAKCADRAGEKPVWILDKPIED